MQEKIAVVLDFWFGQVEETVVPTANRARVWFGDSPEIDAEIKQQFTQELEKAKNGQLQDWEQDCRGQLALIILLDQFSRHIYHDHPEAYTQDGQALAICLAGMEKESDHGLSLIERVFYYFPLMHSENIGDQEKSIMAYRQLSELALPETRIIYESFLRFAHHHFGVIQRFGRFPQRNAALARKSTDDEIVYLKEIEDEK